MWGKWPLIHSCLENSLIKENWKRHLTSDNTSWSALHSMDEVTICRWVIQGYKFLFWNTCRSCMYLRIFVVILWLGEWSFFSFFLCWSSSISSIPRFPSTPFAVNASSLFMYFWALNRRSVIVVGGVFPREKMRLGLFSLAWKVIIITWSFASSISNTALLKHFIYSLWVSLSCCFIVSRYEVDLLWRRPPMKWRTKELLSCSKFAIDAASNLLNHTLVAPLRVARNDLQITSFGVYWRFNIVLNAPMWFRESLVPS